MWVDQPTRSLPAFIFQTTSHLSGGFEWGDQSVTIDLPGPLHSGSSVTTDEHLYMKIDIPSPTPEEQDGVNPPLGRGHATQAIAMPKIPWKPRVTLMAEVVELLNWGMTED